VRAHFKIDPLRTWYYPLSSNFYTMVILFQVDPVVGYEPETVCEGYYEIENTSIFAWSSNLGIGHYHLLLGSIRRLSFNNKVDYLIRTI